MNWLYASRVLRSVRAKQGQIAAAPKMLNGIERIFGFDADQPHAHTADRSDGGNERETKRAMMPSTFIRPIAAGPNCSATLVNCHRA